MNILTLLMTLSFIFAQTVEIKLPEFSREVQEQGSKKDNQPSDLCTVAQEGGANSGLSCGTDKKVPGKKAPLGKLGNENSQYAQDKLREDNSKRR